MGTISKQLLIGNKKGDLQRVWTAAHFPKRINKELVEETNISSSVDKILGEEFPAVTYRILGYYLLGVARIYCKKVEYLLVDCNHSLNQMKFFFEGRKKVDINYGGTCLPESSSQRSQLNVADTNSSESSRRHISNTFIEAMRAQFAPLSLPENFNLDAYDLEIVEDDSSNDHVRPHLELVLSDAWENHRTVHHTFGKDPASASTSAMITNETSVEKFRHRFVLEECLEPMVLSDDELVLDYDERVLDSSPLIVQELEWNNHNNPESSHTMAEGVKNPDKHPVEECTTTGRTAVSEMTSVDNIMLKPSPNKSQPSVTISVTPQSKAPVVSGERKSGLVAEGVQNPESSHAMSEGGKSPDKHPDEECTTTGQTVVSEMASVDNIMFKPSPNKSQPSVTISVTPQSKAPVVSGERKSALVAEGVKNPESFHTMSEGGKSSDKHSDEECTTNGQTVVSEMASVDNIMLKPSPNKSQPSVTISVTPQSKAPVVSGERKSSLVVEGVNNPESSHTMSEGGKSPDKHPDEECTTTGRTVVSEMTSVDNIMLKPSPNKSHLSVTINVTPQSKASVVSGEHKSELVAVRTPASREHVPPKRKRKCKCVYDYAIVVPNEVYETWVLDASDLVRKRRTWTHIRDRKERPSFDYFTQPQISINVGSPIEDRFVSSAHEQVVMEEVEEMTGLAISKHIELAQLNVHEISQETEAEVIAPLTPATQSVALRFHDAPETSMVNQMGPTSSCESRERALFPIRDSEFDETQREEGPIFLGEDNREDVLAAEKLSAVTKSVGGYLHRIFVRREKKGEDETINLSTILKQKTKTESARLFYQMLVLKTGGYIDVKQEKPYDEICVKRTQKLKEAFGGGSRE